MKFVALALALLLAVGSHAASMQADAPADSLSSLDHVSIAIDDGLKQIHQSFITALNELGDDHKEIKEKLTAKAGEAHEWINTHRAIAKPAVQQALEIFEGSVGPTISKIRSELMSKGVKEDMESLIVLVKNHMNDYLLKAKPVTDSMKKSLDDISSNFGEAISGLQESAETNMLATRDKVVEILEKLKEIGTVTLSDMKVVVQSYMDEYTDRIKMIVENVRSKPADDWQDLASKVSPEAEKLRANMYAIMGIITDAIIPSQ